MKVHFSHVETASTNRGQLELTNLVSVGGVTWEQMVEKQTAGVEGFLDGSQLQHERCLKVIPFLAVYMLSS